MIFICIRQILIANNKSKVFSSNPPTDADGTYTYGFTVFDPLAEKHQVWAHMFY